MLYIKSYPERPSCGGQSHVLLEVEQSAKLTIPSPLLGQQLSVTGQEEGHGALQLLLRFLHGSLDTLVL